MITLRAKFIIRISESKSYFFEKMSKILKLLSKLIRKKGCELPISERWEGALIYMLKILKL